MLYEFYPSKLIYFFPVKILLGLIGLQYVLLGIVITFSDTLPDILDSSNYCQNKKQADRDEILKLSENCLKQYVSFLSKIISDKNVKITYLKCHVFKALQALLAREQFFTDEEVLCFFNFIDEIHNDK